MNKTIIACPYFETGGPEALHQLCDAINNTGGEAYIWYYGEKHNMAHPSYSHYNIKLIDEIIDEVGYNIVFPEIEGKRVPLIKNAQVYFWWLSANHESLLNNDFEHHGNSFKNPNIIHLYQSYWALYHLWDKGAIKYLPLFDYINDDFIKQSLNIEHNKENIVCFNPQKGYEYTSHIINFLPNVQFIPLINMSRNQIIDTLKKSKIYIDFGYHPGKDRFPREAALMNNIVISGFRGSAMFYNDMPIEPLKYKFNVDNLKLAADEIEDCLKNYDKRIKDFNLYKNIILNQKEEFINQTKQIFKNGTI
jgi:hypothetical protein